MTDQLPEAARLKAPPPAAGRIDPATQGLRVGRAPEGLRSGYGLASVLGADDRRQILDASLPPWRMICSLILHAAGTAVGIGTGWFVGPTTIATAGHCLYPRGLSLDEVTVVPARSEEMEPFGRRTVTKEAFDAHEAWKSRREPSRDVGVIRLEAPFDGVDSWFRAAALGDDILRGYLVNIAGFPAEVQVPMRRKTGGDELWLHSNAIVGLTPDTLRYAVDTSGGQSGGPVWLYEPGGNEPIVVAVHAYGKPPRLPGMPEPSANSGTRIDAEILALFRRWGAS